MFQMHKVGNDEVSLYNGEHDEDENQNIMWNAGEGNTYFKQGNDEQNPKGTPDDLFVFRIMMLLYKLVMDVAGVIAVLMRWIMRMLICHNQ